MALGQFSLAFSEFGNMVMRNELLSLGLGLLIIGNGFFKPNISTLVGRLYTDDDPRKDSAFTIFYMGINLGALFSPLIAGSLGEKFGWQYGFGSAALGMIIATFWFYSQRAYLGGIGLPPRLKAKNPDAVTLENRDRFDILWYIMLSIVLVWGFLKAWGAISTDFKNHFLSIAAIIGSIALIYVISSNTKGRNEWSRVGVIFILCLFNILFWSGFEQAGGTFNLFASDNTNRMIFSWQIPAAFFQSINPGLIMILAPLFS